MRLNKNISKPIFGLLTLFSLFYSAIFVGVACAAPGIKITKPANGSTVTPGQAIVIRVESVDGFKVTDGDIAVSKNFYQSFSNLPMDFNVTIAKEAVGTVFVSTMADGMPGNFSADKITLKVQQTATIQSLEIDQNEIWVDVDWDGNISAKGKHSGSMVSIDGVYSDGVERDITDDPNTTYISSDPSVISIDNKGNYQVYKVGQASVSIANSGISKTMPVTFNKPSGMKPSQTIPPTTQINIQPPANSAGWYNKDITIIITAEAHEPDVVQEISYQFPYLNARPTDVNGSPAVIPFSQEGINLFRYVAYDNERNSSGQQSVTIQLDKTSPVVLLSLNPYSVKLPFKCEDHYFLLPFFYKLSYSATDKLSGVKSVNGGLAIPDINSYKTQLIKRSSFQIILNEKTQHIIIASSNPQETLTQLKTNKIVPIDNNQVMHLNEREKLNIWTITKIGSYLAISAPSITFEATAQDNADNIATKEIKYARKVIPLPDYVKPLISKKELSSEEIDDLEDDAVIDADTLKTIRKNYGKIP